MQYKAIIKEKNSIYRKAIWLYLILLIFEGAIRRWVLPSLATPLLIVRDPIVIWLVLVGINKGWIHNVFAVSMMVIATISLFFTLITGHQNILVGLFGWRIYFFYFPFIFVIGHIISREDILKMGRFILYLSIPMTVLIVIQFYSPQSAWVNIGVGGDVEGAGFGGALGFFRPPGTFSFITGYTNFQMVVACFLFYYLLSNKLLDRKFQIKQWLLWVMLVCFIISIPYSISRTHLFQSIAIGVFVLIGSIFTNYKQKVLKIISLFVVAISIVFLFNLQGESLNAFTARFESASEAEGGVQATLGSRYFGSTIRAINFDFPTWGYGIGYGSNVGAKLLGLDNMYTKFNSDQEWVRVFAESGLILGALIMLVRVLLFLQVFLRAFKLLIKRQDFLPWLLSATIFMLMLMGQFNVTTALGFGVFVTGLGLASLKSRIKLRLSRINQDGHNGPSVNLLKATK